MSPNRRRPVAAAGVGQDGTAAALRTLRVGLGKVGYTCAAVRRLLNITFPDDIGLLNRAPALARLASDRSALATVIRAFFLEEDVPRRGLGRVFSESDYAGLVNARALRARGANVSARVRVDPVGDAYVFADRRLRGYDRGALRLPGKDPVYPPGADSMLLRDAIVAPAARRVLDLCTGSGVQALHVAGRAEHVVAVDVNPRAAAVTRMNAHLNSARIDVRVGDLYAPVRGEQFELIIANPPFVASPYARGPAYHSGGPTGDRVLQRIMAGLHTHLTPEGRAFAISHVALRSSEDVAVRVRNWDMDFPGRILVLVLETGSAVDLAAAQALFALDRGLTAYATEVRRWVAYLHRHRILTVALLLIVAARGMPRGVDVVEAAPRVLPIPLTKPPAARIADWLAAR